MGKQEVFQQTISVVFGGFYYIYTIFKCDRPIYYCIKCKILTTIVNTLTTDDEDKNDESTSTNFTIIASTDKTLTVVSKAVITVTTNSKYN